MGGISAAAAMSLVAACSGAFTEGIAPSGDGGTPGADSGPSADGSPGVDGSDDRRPNSCLHNADCGTGRICGYKTADACAASGLCFDAPSPGTAQCHSYVPGCTCDGTVVNLTCNEYPMGYAGRPVAHAGTCGSTGDAAPACASDSDCANGQLCAFRIADGCSATGECFAKPPPGPTCAAYSAACTCSDQTINVICTEYPNGYAAQPIAHQGACEAGVSIDAGDAGGASDAGTFACGNTTCAASEVCKSATGGAAPAATAYSCVAFPTQCTTKRACSCVQQALGAQTCMQQKDTFTVGFLYP